MNKKKKKGFTLIELIVVIAILGILAAVMIPRFTGFQDKARSTQALVDAKQVATAFDGWFAEHNNWNATAAQLSAVSGVAEAEIAPEADGGLVITSGTHHASRATGADPIALVD